MKNFRWIAGAALLVATVAVAQADQYTATLAQPLPEKKEIITNGNIWRCAGSTCVLASVPTDPASVRTCHALQRRAGTLTAYGSQERPFDAGKLAACNTGG